MGLRNTATEYGLVTKVLHWLLAALIPALIGLGYWMVDLGYYDRWYNRSLELHKGLGMLAMLLGVVKVLWALGSARVALGDALKPWQHVAAMSTHRAFYLLMVLIPATGYLVSTSAGDDVSIFGWVDFPALIAQSEGLRDLAIELHYWMAYAAGVLLCVHAGAALKHQFLDRDGTLRKML